MENQKLFDELIKFRAEQRVNLENAINAHKLDKAKIATINMAIERTNFLLDYLIL